MSIVPPLPVKRTVDAVIDEPPFRAPVPPNRSVVPAEPVNAPVLMPPPSNPSVPPETVMSARWPALLLNARRIEVSPAPSVLRTVPLFVKLAAPWYARLIDWLFWISQVPPFVSALFCPVRMSPVPVQVVVPLVFRWRPPVKSWTAVPPIARLPLKVVVPVPLIKPPFQVEAPETVTTSVPLNVPAEKVRVVVSTASPLLKFATGVDPAVPMATVEPTATTLAAASKLIVPALMVVWPLTL